MIFTARPSAGHVHLAACFQCRFARRARKPNPVPAVLPAVIERRPHIQERPEPRPGGYDLKIYGPRGGAVPRLTSLIIDEGYNPPFLDPGSPLPMEPIEDQDPKPWKVLRSRNGNLPVYTRYRYGGTEVTTLVTHFFGDIESMKKELMMVCEAPCRLRPGKLEVRGLHKWKIKEWLLSLGM
eukprot:symbB.v1.2.010850.t1/scaffold716.1/size187362/3